MKIKGSSAFLLSKGETLEVVIDPPHAQFQYFVYLRHGDIQTKYWEIGSFPTARKLKLTLQEDENKILKRILKKGDVMGVLELLVPILEAHTARQ